MKRLTLFAVLAASLLAWAAPVFAQIPGGTPWRTCMRYGGRDSTVMHTGSSSLYYLDIYSMTMARFKGDSVYFDSGKEHAMAALGNASATFLAVTIQA